MLLGESLCLDLRGSLWKSGVLLVFFIRWRNGIDSIRNAMSLYDFKDSKGMALWDLS